MASFAAFVDALNSGGTLDEARDEVGAEDTRVGARAARGKEARGAWTVHTAETAHVHTPIARSDARTRAHVNRVDEAWRAHAEAQRRDVHALLTRLLAWRRVLLRLMPHATCTSEDELGAAGMEESLFQHLCNWRAECMLVRVEFLIDQAVRVLKPSLHELVVSHLLRVYAAVPRARVEARVPRVPHSRMPRDRRHASTLSEDG